MEAGLWMSIGLGAGIGLLYGVASWLTVRRAARYRDNRFVLVFFGGMIARMFFAAALVMLVLVLVSVQLYAFVGTLLVVFLIGLVAEVWFVHRRQSGTA